MKIKFIPGKTNPEFEIYEENKIVMHIKIDNETQAFRIRCQDNRRVFFLGNEVVKKIKAITLLNEYSQQLGSLTKSKSGINTGEIEIEGLQYTYKMNDDFLKEIDLFEPDNFQPVLSCRLEMGKPSFLNEVYVDYLLFALVWFKFLTKEKAALVQFAET